MSVKTMFDVITVGSNTIDIFAHTDKSQLINIRTQSSNDEFISYPVGSKILVTKMMHNFGGNGTNSAVSFSKLGLKTGYVGKIGKDFTGEQILQALKKNKVTFLGARGNESGTSIILDAMGEDRTILTFKGCNNDLSAKEVNFKKIKSKWLYISSMLGESLDTMIKIADHSKRIGSKIAFNPSQTLLESEPEKAKQLIKIADLVVLNKEEAALIARQITVEENLKRISSIGPKIVVITDGRNGAVALNEGIKYTVFPRKDLKIQETTGAGDAFASTLTASMLLKKPFHQCLKMAMNQAEAVIQGHGAQNNLLSRQKLFSLVKKDTRELDEKKI